MKNIKQTRLIILCLAINLLSACGGDGATGPSLQEIAFEKLAGTWSMATSNGVLLDGQEVSLNYPGFSLSFTDGTYQTTNAGDLLSATGTWSWSNESAQELTLDTGEDVTIQTLTENQFRFTFFHQGSTAAGIRGNYTVNVEK